MLPTIPISLDFSSGTGLSNLIATFELSAGASAAISGTAQVSGTTANDFSSPVTYTVTAQDGTTHPKLDRNRKSDIVGNGHHSLFNTGFVGCGYH